MQSATLKCSDKTKQPVYWEDRRAVESRAYAAQSEVPPAVVADVPSFRGEQVTLFMEPQALIMCV